ncbi:MAG: ABC transporter ATP-binding protein [Chloroflexi bacterium]|nr:MAG: ABC transporter ATP-binding protein [Chloroflexota bacterium]TMC68786.1 MAG: ABC transporter ATP-binding protein [Chloroflexota bacterium]
MWNRLRLRERIRDRDTAIFGILFITAVVWPMATIYATDSTFLIAQAGHAGTYVLLAIGLNVVVGFAGLLDLGYAAFFAIGAYTYALFASNQLASSPLHHEFHMPFWLMLFVGMVVAAVCGAILGFPTLRLRGDYLAIVTLGFGEIVPQLFYNFDQWTGGINAIGNIDQPSLPYWITGPWAEAGITTIKLVPNFSFAYDPVAFYVLIVILVILAVILVRNLHSSRLGRAWMAIREDEVAAAAMGINTVTTKLLAFAIGASFSGFAGAYYGASFGIVSPDSFLFTVSITVLVMIVLGGMGNITGVIVGALAIYFVLNNLLPALPAQVESLADSVGLGSLNVQNGDWPGLAGETQRIAFLLYGLILVVMMLLRPQGLVPSRVREQELKHDAVLEEETAVEQAHA